ncbi:MAG: LppX_LprAFG lipoprotein [Anaerolineales bacterium]|nr:LppX_LprAFG lipoprotein [Anaerolineales bacterium]
MKNRIWFLALFLLLLAACADDPPPPAPDEIITQMSAALAAQQSFHFAIDRSGAPAYVDPGNTLSFRHAEGDFLAPDKAQAAVRVNLPGIVTEISLISIGPIQWQTNVLTGRWEELPPNWGFNPTVLFDEAEGLPAILAADLQDVALAGTETLEDGPDAALYHLTGSVAGDRLFEMSGGLIGPETVSVDLWVAPETFLPQRIVVVEPEPERDEPSVWQVDFSQFNQEIEITPPTS